jgi:hypothetical protein
MLYKIVNNISFYTLILREATLALTLTPLYKLAELVPKVKQTLALHNAVLRLPTAKPTLRAKTAKLSTYTTLLKLPLKQGCSTKSPSS